MMQALIEHQFALANERNNSLPMFLKQLQLTNILTGMFDQSTRSVPITVWRLVVIWFSFCAHLLKQGPHFEFPIRSFLRHLLKRIEYSTNQMGGWADFKEWCRMVNTNCSPSEQQNTDMQ